MEKRIGVSAKYIQKKCILGKIQWPKITFGAKHNGENKNLGQNTMEKSVEVAAKYKEKIACWAKYDRNTCLVCMCATCCVYCCYVLR